MKICERKWYRSDVYKFGIFFRSFLPHNWDKTADNSDTLFTTILICFLTNFQNGPDLCPDNNSPSLFFPFMRDPCGLEPSLTLIKNVLQDAVSKILRLAFIINVCPSVSDKIILLPPHGSAKTDDR